MKEKLALFGSLKFGTGDYIAHVYPFLSDIFDTKVFSFSHMSLDDEVTASESELVFRTIPDPHLVVRPATFKTLAESYIRLSSEVLHFQPQYFNLHITAFVRVLHYFFTPFVQLLQKNQVKVIYTFHDVLHIGEETLVTNDILQPFYRLPDAAIVGNEMEKERLVSIFGFQKPLEIGPHGTYDLFDQGKYDIDSARKELGIAPEDFVVLFFGILRENKGLEYLLRAMALLKKNSQDRPITLYVAATIRDTFEMKKKYETLAKELGIADRVIFDIREVKVFTLQEIEAVFRACNAVCLPYTHISQSGILNLAMGFGKPVILTDAFLESEYVEKKLGYVVPKENEVELARAIESLYREYTDFMKSFVLFLSEYRKTHSWENLSATFAKLAQSL